MKLPRSTQLAAGALLASTLWLLSGCNQPNPVAKGMGTSSSDAGTASIRSLPAGTRIAVTLGSTISSETAHIGDAWRGMVTRDVVTSTGAGIPAGSRVVGEVASVTAARRGSRAMLQLELTRIRIDGNEQPISASAAAVIAGSTRKRNVGAIAGGAVAGALLGRVVGDGRNAAAGGLIGGAAATGVVATSKGFQVVLSDGQVMHFVVSQAVAMR